MARRWLAGVVVALLLFGSSGASADPSNWAQRGDREARLQLALHSPCREAQAGALRRRFLLPLGLEPCVRAAAAHPRLGPGELLRLVRGPAPEPDQDPERVRGIYLGYWRGTRRRGRRHARIIDTNGGDRQSRGDVERHQAWVQERLAEGIGRSCGRRCPGRSGKPRERAGGGHRVLPGRHADRALEVLDEVTLIEEPGVDLGERNAASELATHERHADLVLVAVSNFRWP
jgi:hypothetical protein